LPIISAGAWLLALALAPPGSTMPAAAHVPPQSKPGYQAMMVHSCRRRAAPRLVTLVLAALGCGVPCYAAPSPGAAEETAQAFIARINIEVAVPRVQATYITPDTGFLAAKASEKSLACSAHAIAASAS